MASILSDYKFVKVIKRYQARNDDEMDLRVGDIVIYGEEIDRWACGISGDEGGWFPLNFTTEIEEMSHTKSLNDEMTNDYFNMTAIGQKELNAFCMKFKSNISKFGLLIHQQQQIYGDIASIMVHCKRVMESLIPLNKSLEICVKDQTVTAGQALFTHFEEHYSTYLEYIDFYLLNYARITSKTANHSCLVRNLPEVYSDDYASFSQFFYAPVVNLKRLTVISKELADILPDAHKDKLNLLKAYNGIKALLDAIDSIRNSFILFTEILKSNDPNGNKCCERHQEPIMAIKVLINDKDGEGEMRYLSLHPKSILLFSFGTKKKNIKLEKEMKLENTTIEEIVGEESSENFTIDVADDTPYHASVMFENIDDSKFFYEAVEKLKKGESYQPFWRRSGLKKSDLAVGKDWKISNLSVDRMLIRMLLPTDVEMEENIILNLKKFIYSILPSNCQIPVGSDILQVNLSEMQLSLEEEIVPNQLLTELTNKVNKLEVNVEKLTKVVETLTKMITKD